MATCDCESKSSDASGRLSSWIGSDYTDERDTACGNTVSHILGRNFEGCDKGVGDKINCAVVRRSSGQQVDQEEFLS